MTDSKAEALRGLAEKWLTIANIAEGEREFQEARIYRAVAGQLTTLLSEHGGGGEAVAVEDPCKALLRLPWVIGETYTTLDIPGLRIPCSYRLEWIDRSEHSFAVAVWRDLERHTLHLQNLGDFQPPKAATTPPTPSAPVGCDVFRNPLVRWGRHDASCATCHDSVFKPRPVCTCGLDVATSALQHPASPSVSPAVEGGLPDSTDFLPCCTEAKPDGIEIHRVSAPWQLRGDLYLALCKWCGRAAPFVSVGFHGENVMPQAIAEWNRRLATHEQPATFDPEHDGDTCRSNDLYAGNSVGWWKSKADNYKNGLLRVCDALGSVGVKMDGSTPCWEYVAQLRPKQPGSAVQGETVAKSNRHVLMACAANSPHGIRLAAMLRDDVKAGDFCDTLVALFDEVTTQPPAPAAEQETKWLDIPPFLRRNATPEEHAAWKAKRAEQPEGKGAIPTVCDGKEQEAFEVFATSMGWKMEQHPLHYLFLDPLANAGRAAWREAITYCNLAIAAAPAAPVGVEGLANAAGSWADFLHAYHRASESGLAVDWERAAEKAMQWQRRVSEALKPFDRTAALAGKEGAAQEHREEPKSAILVGELVVGQTTDGEAKFAAIARGYHDRPTYIFAQQPYQAWAAELVRPATPEEAITFWRERALAAEGQEAALRG